MICHNTQTYTYVHKYIINTEDKTVKRNDGVWIY